jgi:hypothetical protein
LALKRLNGAEAAEPADEAWFGVGVRRNEFDVVWSALAHRRAEAPHEGVVPRPLGGFPLDATLGIDQHRNAPRTGDLRVTVATSMLHAVAVRVLHAPLELHRANPDLVDLGVTAWGDLGA